MQQPHWIRSEIEEQIESRLHSRDMGEVASLFAFLLSEGDRDPASPERRWAIDAALRLASDSRVVSDPGIRPLMFELYVLWDELRESVQARIVDELLARVPFSDGRSLYEPVERMVGRGVAARQARRHLSSLLGSPVASVREVALMALEVRLTEINRADAADLQLESLLHQPLGDTSPDVRVRAETLLAWCVQHGVPLT